MPHSVELQTNRVNCATNVKCTDNDYFQLLLEIYLNLIQLQGAMTPM